MLAFLRLDRSYSEDEVAQKLGFGSVEAMRIQLKRWGVPEWMLDEAPAIEGGQGRLLSPAPYGIWPPCSSRCIERALFHVR
jgi:hypothetical protein